MQRAADEGLKYQHVEGTREELGRFHTYYSCLPLVGNSIIRQRPEDPVSKQKWGDHEPAGEPQERQAVCRMG